MQEIVKGRFFYRFIKRLIDIVASLVGLILLAPLFLVIAILIAKEDGFPVFFAQERNGLNGKVFKMYKFRSMCKNAPEMHKTLLKENELDGPAFKMKEDPRITKIGKFIRKTSIEELPQLLNILKGEMSFIGPRPVLTYHPWPFEEYSEEQKRRFAVRPGITGLAQINGRKATLWDARLKYDAEYVDNLSFVNDVKIFFKTIFSVLKSESNENVGETVETKK